LFCAYFDLGKQGLNFHTGIIIGTISICWSGHLVHLAIPIARGSFIALIISTINVCEFYTGNWVYDIAAMDKDENILSHSHHAGSSLLTFFGGLKSNTISLYLTDIAHHHLVIGILFVLSSHLYCLLYKAVAHRGKDVSNPHAKACAIIMGLHKSLHLDLSLGCTGLAVYTSVLAEQISLVTPYVYFDHIATS